MEKCVGCFLVYQFLGVFFWLKGAKKMCICVGVKNHIVTCEKFIFCCEQGCEWIWVLGSPKTYYYADEFSVPDIRFEMCLFNTFIQ